MSKINKLENRLEKLEWEVKWRTRLNFSEFRNGVLFAEHKFTVDVLICLILDYLGLEPREVPSKNILAPSKNVLKKKKEK